MQHVAYRNLSRIEREARLKLRKPIRLTPNESKQTLPCTKLWNPYLQRKKEEHRTRKENTYTDVRTDTSEIRLPKNIPKEKDSPAAKTRTTHRPQEHVDRLWNQNVQGFVGANMFKKEARVAVKARTRKHV